MPFELEIITHPSRYIIAERQIARRRKRSQIVDPGSSLDYILYIYLGDYPEIMRSLVDDKSSQQGFLTSRLPSFTPQVRK